MARFKVPDTDMSLQVKYVASWPMALLVLSLFTAILVMATAIGSLAHRVTNLRVEIISLRMDLQDYTGIHQEVTDQEDILKYGRHHRAPYGGEQ